MSHPADAVLTALDLKSIADDGTFEGYASLFDTQDLGRDVILPGAFRRSLAVKGASGIRLLFQHRPEEPIGVWTELVEDAKGLFARGRLATGASRGREVLALMRAGAIDGLSIGFRVLEAHRDHARGIRRIRRLDLWEISVVTFPMLPGARISRVAMPGSAVPLEQRGRRLPQQIAAMASSMRQRLSLTEPRSLTARAAELAGERALLALMQAALVEERP